jgi:hypothetical protein
MAVVLVITEGARSSPLDENAALALLERAVKHDRIYDERISSDCISFGTEESTDAYFEFVLREIHKREVRRRSRNKSCHRSPSRLSTFWQNPAMGSG